ncbi:sensor histidine kinase [Shimia abyssi]|uniref:histidine kinase n=1 Tax=Shimia abyssi TaxID=1662395 RepID=A0A2P8FHG7_9RHOB|nr:sensor histidine kinase [Shimia abyssi]PSL21172.1 two-component system sensor histidine kinase TctE [Shimia abyssi]
MTSSAPADVQVRGALRNRLVISLVGGAAVLAILIFLVVRSYAAQIAQQGQDDVLGASVTSILDAAIIRNGVIQIDIPYASFSMLNTPSDDRVFYAVYQDGTPISGYADLPPPLDTNATKNDFRTVTYNGTPVRLATAARVLIGADVRTEVKVSVAQTRDALSGTLNRISRNVALFGAGFFLLATVLSFWATSTTISRLRRLTDSVTRRGPKDLSPVAKPVPVEMAPLVSSLNSLMSRLDQSLHRSEDFIAEAAHRVRTPLATVRSHAEATLHRVEREENRQALRAMMRAIDESSRAAGQLLDHAMITFRADHLELQNLDLVDLVQDLVTRLTPIADMKHIDLRLTGDTSVPVSGDPILLQNALRNLIDNALKYAPSETEISLNVTTASRPTVEIRDQGAGFPTANMADLVSRFSRGENASDTIGSGLGLTIAQDVAAAHGGALVLSNNPKGGACVTLSL